MYENIGFGDVSRLADEESLLAAARKSGANAVAQALQGGYSTLLGKGFAGANDLSLGQW